jgi:hypothetical protein
VDPKKMTSPFGAEQPFPPWKTRRRPSWFERLCCRLGWHRFTVVTSRDTLEFGAEEGDKKVLHYYYSRWCPICDMHWHREEGGDGTWLEGPYWKAFEELRLARSRLREAADAAFAALGALSDALEATAGRRNPK